MNPEKWQKIKEIFNQAIEMETGKRISFVESACQNDEEILSEVEKLLAEDGSDETLFDPFIEPISITTSTNPLGKSIGKYFILKEIGEGGMGSVYLAEHSELGNKVALKIVKRGMDTADLLRRFRTEQQILANLQHPNIAHLLDNGKTEDGLPYYVMEFVEGETLLEFTEKNQLSTKERLEIFRKICSAVQFAHNHLVVHRDLKPSNILITKDNQPKLLDFGIAKVLTPDKIEVKGTATMMGMMTPNYASPEQLRGETVTTASDIYSLGVILYELMTGTIPFNMKQFSLVEMMQVVSTTEPKTPSNVINQVAPNTNIISQLKGDLDNIILKSLKKEPERRYLSAEQFSEDIRRHLEGLPVKARPDTLGYRTSKFIKRNKLGVAAASLIFLSLIGGIIGTTYQRARAEKRFEDLRQLSSSLIFKYNDSIANFPGATATRAMFVQEATQFLDSLADEQNDDVKIQLELAQAYLKAGDLQSEIAAFDTKQTLETYQKSLKIAEKLFTSDSKNVEYANVYASALKNVGALQSDKDSGLSNLQKSVSLREEILQMDAENFENKFGLVETYLAIGSFYPNDSGTEYFRKALQLSEILVNEPTATAREWRLFAKTNQKLATILPPSEAINFQNKAVEFYSTILQNKPNIIQAKQELGIALLQRADIFNTLKQNNLTAIDRQKAVEIFDSLSQSDPKNEELKKLLAQAKGESKIKENSTNPIETETVKDDIFKK